MFWEDQLKAKEFKRILKEKDFSAVQHAKQAARSRIYQPRPATTFRTHGYSQTSFSTPHFQTDQLKVEKLKKDFSALQHAKQAAVSRIYEPATATFEPHGFSQTSFSTPYFKAKVNIRMYIHLVRSVSI